MSHPQHGTVRNHLLSALTPTDFALLEPFLVHVQTHPRQTLIEPDETIHRLFFPEVGYASIMADRSLRRAEIGMVGREGLIGAAPILLGSNQTANHVFVQGAGDMLSIEATHLIEAVAQSPSLHKHLLHFIQAQIMQTGRTASINATYFTDARLARWVLMCQDRSDGDELFVTHEALALMLGIQRGTATLLVQALEGQFLIKATRGRITIRDRDGLIAMAQGSYGAAEAGCGRFTKNTSERSSPFPHAPVYH